MSMKKVSIERGVQYLLCNNGGSLSEVNQLDGKHKM